MPIPIMTDLASPPAAAASPAATAELDIGGMSCASCVRRVEKALSRVPGVVDVSVNLATERASVGLATAAAPAKLEALVAAVAGAGYEARPVVEAPRGSDRDSGTAAAGTDADRDAARHRQSQRELAAVAVAAAFSLPLMLPMLAEAVGGHWMLPAWLQLILAASCSSPAVRGFMSGPGMPCALAPATWICSSRSALRPPMGSACGR